MPAHSIGPEESPPFEADSRYKWIALSNTTLGTLMATINQSIVLIAMPNIFRGIGLNPLTPGNTGYLLWMLLGFMVAMAVLVVSLGRIGDMFGRVRMYNLGFAVFTVFSILLSVTWLDGGAGALWLIAMRIGQGVGGAMLFSNANAIVTDAFPPHQRGIGLGINNVAFIAGSFIGLVLGGVLAPVEWRLVFLVSVPFGIFGTVWAYANCATSGSGRKRASTGGATSRSPVGLILILIGITYGLLPYGGHSMGWTNPTVLGELLLGVVGLIIFAIIETRVPAPMFHLGLFRIRAFAAGNAASFLAALARGGLMFMLVIWLQGIWLPLHGYSFERTPLWAGIYMVPLTVGFLLSGPLAGHLADKYGARPFATGGLVLSGASFLLLETLPINFPYWAFAAAHPHERHRHGTVRRPNQTGVMNSLPPAATRRRSRMSATAGASAQVLSIGVFFTLMILGLRPPCRSP